MFFFSTAYIMYLVGATFLAMLILIVYVGAIAILFVFCVILFERTPVYSNYFYYRSVIIMVFMLSVFYQISNLFPSRLLLVKNFTQLKFSSYKDIFLSSNENLPVYFFSSQFTFIDSFASFFFITDQGLFYIIFIGFFLFFFTIAVTYAFYFTKR